MRRLVLLTAATTLGMASQAHAGPWSRAYVVDWMEPAFYHGGDKMDNAGSGTDCPDGTTKPVGWQKVFKTPWRTEKDVSYYIDPERRPELQRALRFRGPNYEDVWSQPWLAPDFGMPEVVGKTAYGFNLDDNESTGGFTTPDGAVKGVDNGYYKVGGCWVSYRGQPRTSQRGIGINGYMRDGLYTIVIVVSGKEDPTNDSDATLAFYESQDRIVKDSLGKVARDATFTIKPETKTQSLIPVTVRNGVIETKVSSEIRLRDEAWNSRTPSQLQLTKGKLRLEMTEDGGLEGHFGGYRDWKRLYQNQAINARDGETNQGIDMPSFYYSLKRNADADPDPATGQNRRISVAYSLRAVPSFVMTPDGTRVVTAPEVFDGKAPTQLAAGQ
jgi:hypothetical protein